MFFSMRLAINTYHLIKDEKKMQGEGAAAGGATVSRIGTASSTCVASQTHQVELPQTQNSAGTAPWEGELTEGAH